MSAVAVKMMGKIQNRQKIIDYMRTHKGEKLVFPQIMKDLKMRLRTLRNHLYNLERDGLVVKLPSLEDARMKHWVYIGD